jgi:hypothetical protein
MIAKPLLAKQSAVRVSAHSDPAEQSGAGLLERRNLTSADCNRAAILSLKSSLCIKTY